MQHRPRKKLFWTPPPRTYYQVVIGGKVVIEFAYLAERAAFTDLLAAAHFAPAWRVEEVER